VEITSDKILLNFAEGLMSGIHHLKQLLALKCSSSQENQDEINQQIEQIVGEATCKFKLQFSKR
jgi:hypothetical protein